MSTAPASTLRLVVLLGITNGDDEKANHNYRIVSMNLGCEDNQVSEADRITVLKDTSENFSLKILY